MSELGFAAAVLLASLTLTYFFCLRPMRRGHCATSMVAGWNTTSTQAPDQDAEIARLRQEVSALRAEGVGVPSRAPDR